MRKAELGGAPAPIPQRYIDEAVRPDAQVLLTFSDGSPALGLRNTGLGQCLLANFSPALETSDLAKYGAFVALAQ